jgi:hypothetical protein
MNCKECGTPISRAAVACPKCGHPNKRTPWKKLLLLGFAAFVVISILNARSRVASQVHEGERQLAQARTTPVATEETMPRPTQPAAAPTAVSDQRDPLEFGKPTVKTERSMGMTTVMVKAKNLANRPITCTVTASFMKGDTILGVAMGTTNEHPVGANRTVTMLTTDSIKGYDTVSLEATTCF